MRFEKLSKEEEEKALNLHEDSIVVIAHCDTVIYWAPKPVFTPLYFDLMPWPEKRSLGKRSKFGHIDLPRLLAFDRHELFQA